jgi:hypothetical protein
LLGKEALNFRPSRMHPGDPVADFGNLPARRIVIGQVGGIDAA